MQNFSLPNAAGVITGPAAALSPYQLITHLYTKLLAEFPTLSIHCNTAVETVQGTPVDPFRRPISPVQPYSCFTYQGKSRVIRATHVVHANNGYVCRLLPGLKGKIIPARGQMTSQRLNNNVSIPGGPNRSWSFIWDRGWSAFHTARAILTEVPRIRLHDGDSGWAMHARWWMGERAQRRFGCFGKFT